MSITKEQYSKEENWSINSDIKKSPIDISWSELFNTLFKHYNYQFLELYTYKLYIERNNNPSLLYHFFL